MDVPQIAQIVVYTGLGVPSAYLAASGVKRAVTGKWLRGTRIAAVVLGLELIALFAPPLVLAATSADSIDTRITMSEPMPSSQEYSKLVCYDPKTY